MMNLPKEKIFNLHAIPERAVSKSITMSLTESERIIGAFMSVRDQVIFTDRRLISVEAHGLTGVQQDIIFVPYRHIQYFGIKTAGMGEFVPNSQLVLYFSDGQNMVFDFQERVAIFKIVENISEYCI